jgi:hypothetical protein
VAASRLCWSGACTELSRSDSQSRFVTNLTCAEPVEVWQWGKTGGRLNGYCQRDNIAQNDVIWGDENPLLPQTIHSRTVAGALLYMDICRQAKAL